MTTPLPMQFKVGLVQMSMSDDPEANLGKAVARVSVDEYVKLYEKSRKKP
jgi:hypothetical protein